MRNLQYAHVFKNHGPAAGASVVHTHSQLIALPFVPPLLQAELDGGLAYYAQHERCIFCDVIQSEIGVGERVVLQSPRYVAMVAYAGRQPYETWKYCPDSTSADSTPLTMMKRPNWE